MEEPTTREHFAHGTPVGDHHTWFCPESPACPDCPCCSAALCEMARAKDGACHWYGSGSDYDLSECPCWRCGKEVENAHPHECVADATAEVFTEDGKAAD